MYLKKNTLEWILSILKNTNEKEKLPLYRNESGGKKIKPPPVIINSLPLHSTVPRDRRVRKATAWISVYSFLYLT